jgi:hypothetical protein
MLRRIATVVLLVFTLFLASSVVYRVYVAARWGPRLRASARGSDRLIIKTGCPDHPNTSTDVVRFETTDTNLIAGVLRAFDASADSGWNPRGCGSPTLYFDRGDRTLVIVGIHRGRLRRYAGPYGDALPTSESWQQLTGFLREHGIKDGDFR